MTALGGQAGPRHEGVVAASARIGDGARSEVVFVTALGGQPRVRHTRGVRFVTALGGQSGPRHEGVVVDRARIADGARSEALFVTALGGHRRAGGKAEPRCRLGRRYPPGASSAAVASRDRQTAAWTRASSSALWVCGSALG